MMSMLQLSSYNFRWSPQNSADDWNFSVELNHENSMLAIEIIVEGFVEDLSNICYWDVNIGQSSSVNISPSTSEELDMLQKAV